MAIRTITQSVINDILELENNTGNRMKLKLSYFLFLLSLPLLISCTDCDPLPLPDSASFGFRILDGSTGENVFPSRYSITDFQILTTFMDTVDIEGWRFAQDGNYSFVINPVEGKPFRYNEETQNRFFLVLDHQDTDTLLFSFIPRQDDCTDYMDDFKAYYNGELVAQGTGESTYNTNFNKQ